MKNRGCVEYVRDGEIVGWRTIAEPPDGADFVSVYEDDRLLGTAFADIYREDISDADGALARGFAFAIPDALANGAVHVLSVYAGSGVDELEGSPVRVRLERLDRRPRAPEKPKKQYRQKRAAVVCWDLGHNPVGRAHLCCKLMAADWDVELIGPLWPAFGNDLWAPLKNEGLTIKSFKPSTLVDIWREGARLALSQGYDLVVICKPRLSGLIIGLQIAEQSRCPVLIDIDEDDRAFTKRGSPSDNARELIEQPYGAVGTELAYRHLHVADAITVSNGSLQSRFPGRVVRHARDETAPRADREQARKRLGFADTDFVIAFVGTARSHKGLSSVLSALRDVADANVKLLLAGTIDDPVAREIKASGLGEQVVIHGPFDRADLGGFLAAADLVPLLQNVDADISSTQIPAKFTDALQYGVRTVATDAPPFREMALRGAVDIIEGVEFAEYLETARTAPDSDLLRDHRIRVFEEEFSIAVNRTRFAFAIEEASRNFDIGGTKISSTLRELLAATRAAQTVLAENEPPRASARPSTGEPALDIAFFWKQNDSGLFGRRSDMVVKYLLESERVGRIVHFDQTQNLSGLRHMIDSTTRESRSVAAMQLQQTLGRVLGLADERRLDRRLFLSRGKDTSALGFAGNPIDDIGDYPTFVERSLSSAGLDPARTIAWVCPVVQGFIEVQQRLRFREIVVDLIDDQRTWPHSDESRAILHGQYEDILRIADRVFTNCEGNRRRFAWSRADIHVIPNGAEIPAISETSIEPALLRSLPRPIVGYIGNLRERIDWELLRIMSERKPSWSLVLAGPVEESRVPDWARASRNLILPGPIPYSESRSWISAFDVAIMPHLRSPMTDSMNPLKLYNYLAAGASVVATSVENIDDVADLITVRDNHDDFIAAIEALLASPRAIVPHERLASFSWERRVEAMLAQL